MKIDYEVCFSEVFIFICFVIVLVRWARGSKSRVGAWVREPRTQLGEDSGHSVLIVYVVHQRFTKGSPHCLKMRRVEV